MDSPNRNYLIYKSRIEKEYLKFQTPSNLPIGVELETVKLEVSDCIGVFKCFVPFQNGSSALDLIPLMQLSIQTIYTNDTKERSYPFQAPTVHIHHGWMFLPKDLLDPLKQHSDHHSRTLNLPILRHWNPSNTIRMVLLDFIQCVQQSDPQPSSVPCTQSSERMQRKHSRDSRLYSKRVCLGKNDIRGRIFACRELNANSLLLPAPIVLQQAQIFILEASDDGHARKSRAKNQDVYYVKDLIKLKDISRITPQHGKALTFFFKDRHRQCRIFLTQETEALVQQIRNIIADSKSETGNSGNALAPLLPFLFSEHSERAKELSSRFLSKIGSFASSFTKFLKGEDDDQRLEYALARLEMMQRQCRHAISHAQIREITQNYQILAQEYAEHSEGQVERILSELQLFLENSIVQQRMREIER